jgi:hypothetical protein
MPSASLWSCASIMFIGGACCLASSYWVKGALTCSGCRLHLFSTLAGVGCLSATGPSQRKAPPLSPEAKATAGSARLLAAASMKLQKGRRAPTDGALQYH